ncbi:hypothetical protein [Methylobacter psychrophilus]|uniref:hypothetical protein n=1 Tax=Methylobacter psychrophilus TaxID=96941 RepID=UPI0021D50636|nr:hypothetical protein [Methylobacter psychrophilus]
MKTPRYPAYGKQLAERMRFKNPPALVFIEVGANAWENAKIWQKYANFSALVLTPDMEPHRLKWPVSGCLCLVEWEKAAPESLVIDLVRCLKIAGALNVCVQPLFVDHDSDSHYFDTKTQIFVQIRECLQIYPGKKGAKNVA